MELTKARIFDFLYYQQENYPRKDCLNYKQNGQWISFSTEQVIQIVNNLSRALLNSGIQSGDKVAIVSENRPEWNFIDLALQQIGVVSVPMYPTITIKDYEYILRHAEISMAFVSSKELYDKVKTASEAVHTIPVYSFDKLNDVQHWKELEERGANLSTDLEPHKSKVKAGDLLTIIYTSGTTGTPKGVMLSHSNIASNAIAVAKRVEIKPGIWRAVSFLPLSHIYERTGIYFFIYTGSGIYYAESLEKIGDNIREVKPHIFNCVPRLLEKIYDKIVAKGNELTGVKKKLFFWALNLGLKYEPHKNMGLWYNMQLSLARKLIFSKWQEALGGEVEIISSGGAALQPRLGRVFWAAGIRVSEGYGLTETSPVITASIANPKDIRIGTVGPTIEGVEIKIAEDGEILCKGPNVMMGYYKDPEKTAEVMTGEWFHTGDIGELVEGKYLKITDRKKEIFKTSGGKYVAPQVMENKFKESVFIETLIVIGEGRKFPAALIHPNLEEIQNWLRNKTDDIPTEPEKLLSHELVRQKIHSEVEKLNLEFAQWEKVKQFRLIHENFSIEGGELTPKLSLKRRVIHSKYDHLIEEIYSGQG